MLVSMQMDPVPYKTKKIILIFCVGIKHQTTYKYFGHELNVRKLIPSRMNVEGLQETPLGLCAKLWCHVAAVFLNKAVWGL